MKASEQDFSFNKISTGFSELDVILGGGVPTKKILEVAGSWSVGKSTLAYQIIASAQKQGRPVLLIDAERAYTNEYGALMGVDTSTLDVFRARTAEEYLDYVELWIEGNKEEKIKGHKGGLVIIDAIGQLLPKEEAEKSSEGRVIGLQARLIGSFCRKIIPILDDTDTALLILNHTFIPLGQMGIASSGGKKLEYARSVWLIMSRAYGAAAKVKKDTDGKKTFITMQIEVKKNKLVPNEGTKIFLEYVPEEGFLRPQIPEPIPSVVKRGPGRPKLSTLK